VIRFVELIDNVPFPDAVNKLNAEGPKSQIRRHSGGLKASPKTIGIRVNGQTGLTVKERKLLTRVFDFYHTAFYR